MYLLGEQKMPHQFLDFYLEGVVCICGRIFFGSSVCVRAFSIAVFVGLCSAVLNRLACSVMVL